MSKSMCLDVIHVGSIGYADRIAIDDNDPLNILITEEEEGEAPSSYPNSSTHCWPIIGDCP